MEPAAARNLDRVRRLAAQDLRLFLRIGEDLDALAVGIGADRLGLLRALGAAPVVLDVFDSAALTRAVTTAAPQAVIHQLTDLAFAPGTPQHEEGLARNAHLRIEASPEKTSSMSTTRMDLWLIPSCLLM